MRKTFTGYYNLKEGHCPRGFLIFWYYFKMEIMLFSFCKWKMPRVYFMNCWRASSEMIFILNKFIFVGLNCTVKIKRQQLGLWIFCTVPLISNKEAEKAYPARFAHLLPLTPHEYMHAHTLVCLCGLYVCMHTHILSQSTEHMQIDDE